MSPASQITHISFTPSPPPSSHRQHAAGTRSVGSQFLAADTAGDSRPKPLPTGNPPLIAVWFWDRWIGGCHLSNHSWSSLKPTSAGSLPAPSIPPAPTVRPGALAPRPRSPPRPPYSGSCPCDRRCDAPGMPFLLQVSDLVAFWFLSVCHGPVCRVPPCFVIVTFDTHKILYSCLAPWTLLPSEHILGDERPKARELLKEGRGVLCVK